MPCLALPVLKICAFKVQKGGEIAFRKFCPSEIPKSGDKISTF